MSGWALVCTPKLTYRLEVVWKSRLLDPLEPIIVERSFHQMNGKLLRSAPVGRRFFGMKLCDVLKILSREGYAKRVLLFYD